MRSVTHPCVSLSCVSFSVLFAIALWFTVSPNSDEHQANAENATATNFTLYRSPYHNFSIEIPSNWVVTEYKKAVSLNNGLPLFVVAITDVPKLLDYDTLILKNNAETLKQIAEDSKKLYSNTGSGFKPLKQNDVTIAGNAGIKSEFLLQGKYNYDVFTIIDGKLYQFTYSDMPERVPESVRLANKALETFKILNNN